MKGILTVQIGTSAENSLLPPTNLRFNGEVNHGETSLEKAIRERKEQLEKAQAAAKRLRDIQNERGKGR